MLILLKRLGDRLIEVPQGMRQRATLLIDVKEWKEGNRNIQMIWEASHFTSNAMEKYTDFHELI